MSFFDFELGLPEICFFDWDGTLADTTDFLVNAHGHAYDVVGFPRPAEAVIRDHMRFTTNELYPELFGVRAGEAMIGLDAYVKAHHVDELVMKDDVCRVLRGLRESGCLLAVVSNKRQKFLEVEVRASGYGDLFGAVVGAGVAANDKPHIDPVMLALDDLGVSSFLPERSCFFGDTITDARCAQRLGVTYVECSGDDEYCREITQEGIDFKCVPFSKIVEKLVCNF